MMTMSQIIEAFGGTKDFANSIGISQQNAIAMRVAGRIPAWYFRPVVHAANERGIEGVTLDLLADLAANSKENAA